MQPLSITSLNRIHQADTIARLTALELSDHDGLEVVHRSRLARLYREFWRGGGDVIDLQKRIAIERRKRQLQIQYDEIL